MKEKFKSCNEIAYLGKEPDYTTYKFRESSGMVKRVIDYVFIKNEFEVIGYLDLPANEDIDEYMGTPCKNHPSDHFSIVFDIKTK